MTDRSQKEYTTYEKTHLQAVTPQLPIDETAASEVNAYFFDILRTNVLKRRTENGYF
ncbi:hypothetical protein GCM10007362_31540 [Saccharibacillus endophyticus]|uniref:Uncharacterized protein n=1 Tax=Saccharibacillus endophyticus TaxID=2060666 RepID=A0ABQ2A025_9BACL|nr:hypothetical protein GCM10007362_31540 [Saccharibacillus endophyticus]